MIDEGVNMAMTCGKFDVLSMRSGTGMPIPTANIRQDPQGGLHKFECFKGVQNFEMGALLSAHQQGAWGERLICGRSGARLRASVQQNFSTDRPMETPFLAGNPTCRARVRQLLQRRVQR